MNTEEFNCFDLDRVVREIAQIASVSPAQVKSAIELLEAGNTLPFIARYRKEVTKGLDEIALRVIEDELGKAQELANRKNTILKTIAQQGALTAELRKRIEGCFDKKELEDLYLPYKPKQRTRATVAREKGLEPLAHVLLLQRGLTIKKEALLQHYVSVEKGVPDTAAALQGACDIVAEVWAEKVDTRQWLLKQAKEFGAITSAVKRGKKEEGSKFELYYDHREPLKRLPLHRFLAMMRGEAEEILRVGIALDDEQVIRQLKSTWVTNPRFEFVTELSRTAEDAYSRLLLPATESAVLQGLKEQADEEAVAVFAKNLRELLLAPPAGAKNTLGVDPGFRTGCKLAVVDATGKFLENATIYPTPPTSDIASATKTLSRLVEKFNIELIAIGNGTASRETDVFIQDYIKSSGRAITKVIVNESGASIYSASELAVREYPDLDVTVRGAISIAHRLQDPLAELVKIDPKSIGVGQYQHDVNQTLLKKSLDREVESCVNSVGVDLNTASPALLSYVSGIGPKLAERIVLYRDENGSFKKRSELLNVPKLGQKAFEQSAGFLRIRNGDEPLDNSAVHPESYYVVKKMAQKIGAQTKQLVGNTELVRKLNASEFVDEKVGLPTITDILTELTKPGRDPRSEFKVAKFAEGVNEISDLKEGMVLEGVITNVTKFGAFVDLGVHQDALIHVSQLANKFIKDPSEIVAVGDVVRVKVLEVDIERKRIAVSKKQVSG